jgi:hypothetical protein
MTPQGLNLSAADDIGVSSGEVLWYEQNIGGLCRIIVQQTMYMDTVDGAVAYNTAPPYQSTNQLEFDIDGDLGTVCSSVKPQGSDATIACEVYPPQD